MTDHLTGATQEDVVCAICGHDYDFEMPKAIVEAAREGRLVVFAGAGVSTEAPGVFPNSLYDEVRSELSQPPEDESFPGVMSAYQREHGRLKLIETVIERLRFAETFPAVREHATRFHRELATIRPLMEIITTNWDPFFEDHCGALPIVVDGDYAFYNLPERKVYKIHGSTRNISTVVATAEDYAAAEERFRTSAIGGTLRHLLATKVVVFTGFSLRDSDFRNIYGPLLDGMGQLRPVAFLVSPFDSPEAEDLGLRHIKTDGTHFLRSLKAHLVDEKVLLEPGGVARAKNLLPPVREAHAATSAMDWREHPMIVFSLAYQDGLKDVLERVMARWITGEYHDAEHLHKLVHSYNHLLHTAVERRRYWDAAYIDGYLNGLMLLGLEDEAMRHVPLYEYFDPDVFGVAEDDASGDTAENDEEKTKATEGEPDADLSDDDDDDHHGDDPLPALLTEEELLEFLDGVEEELPAALEEARRHLATIPDGMIPQHTPFLYGVMGPPAEDGEPEDPEPG